MPINARKTHRMRTVDLLACGCLGAADVSLSCQPRIRQLPTVQNCWTSTGAATSWFAAWSASIPEMASIAEAPR